MSSLSCLVKSWFPFLRFPLQTPLFRVAVWIPLWPFERSHHCSSSFLSNFGSRMLGSLVIIKRPLGRFGRQGGVFSRCLGGTSFLSEICFFFIRGCFPFSDTHPRSFFDGRIMFCLQAVVIFSSGAPGLFPLAWWNYHFSNAYSGFCLFSSSPIVIHFLVRLSPRVVFSLVGPGRDQLRSAFFMECFFQFYGSLASSLVLSPQFPSWFVRS